MDGNADGSSYSIYVAGEGGGELGSPARHLEVGGGALFPHTQAARNGMHATHSHAFLETCVLACLLGYGHRASGVSTLPGDPASRT